MKAYIRPRPMRVAYLVEENEHWQTMLDGIFAESFSRWGGRFALIVPCENGSIRPAYAPWLETYDADIIYSFINLIDWMVEKIHEQFFPAFLVKHDFLNQKERDHHTYRPRLPVDPLSVFSVMALMGRGGMIDTPQPVTLVDTHIGTHPSPLLQQNFGCYGQSLNPWPIGKDMADYLKSLTFVPPNIQANPNLVPRAQGDIVSSETELIVRLATQRNLCGLAQMSASFAPRMEVNHGNWSRTVNLIVGDSFVDQVVYWNALHLTPAWLNGNIVTLKVAKQDLDDSERFNAIVNMIKNRVYFPIGGNASHAEIVIRSSSLPANELQEIALRLKAAEKWNTYTFEHIASIDSLAPTASALQSARQHVEPGSPFQSHDWHEVRLSENAFRPPIIFPRHLRDTPQLPARAKQGVWQLDLDIERAVDYSGIQNVQHHWRLPRRLRMAGAFTRGYQLHRMSSVCMPRTMLNGLLSITCGGDGMLPEINLPTDETAFRYALCARRDWLPFARNQDNPKPGLAFDIRPSDKGRYLTALLRMSGDIHHAKEIFLSAFWKERFELLGATPKATDERIAMVSKQLRKRFKGGQITSDDEWERLAKLVLIEARAERFPSTRLKFDELRREFDAYRAEYWQKHPTGSPDTEWAEHERRSLAASTKYLCQREILHQGYEWRCRQCFNSNWVGIDEIKRQLICEICGRNEPAPVDDPWHFRLNGFILKGLQEHGLLPLIWCLGKYAERSDASFFYLPPHELFFTHENLENNMASSEVDLLIVSDGVVRLVEAKASSRGIEVTKTAELAKRIKPNIVTLAVMEARSTALQGTLEKLQQHLGVTDIRAELLTLESEDIEESPKLPAGTSYKVRVF